MEFRESLYQVRKGLVNYVAGTNEDIFPAEELDRNGAKLDFKDSIGAKGIRENVHATLFLVELGALVSPIFEMTVYEQMTFTVPLSVIAGVDLIARVYGAAKEVRKANENHSKVLKRWEREDLTDKPRKDYDWFETFPGMHPGLIGLARTGLGFLVEE